MAAPSVTPLALRQWRAEWQGRVRVALNDANRSRKEWEAATSAGASAATEWANAVLQEASLPFLELGALDHLSRDLLPRATLALRAKASSARAELFSAVEASAAAAGLLEGAAASLERGVPSIPIPVPVFASLGLPALAGCFRRAASAQREELERVRRRAVSAADAAVAEWRREGGATTGRKKTSTPSNHVSSTSSSSSSASSSEAVERLRSRLTVVIAAWKLQALLGPGAPEGGKAAVGAAGAGVAAELAAVAAEMEGF